MQSTQILDISRKLIRDVLFRNIKKMVGTEILTRRNSLNNCGSLKIGGQGNDGPNGGTVSSVYTLSLYPSPSTSDTTANISDYNLGDLCKLNSVTCEQS